MSPKELTAFRMAEEVMNGMRLVKDRDGIPMSVQIDRALRAGLEKKGVALEKSATASRQAGRRRTGRAR
jgi:hypothetical protein